MALEADAGAVHLIIPGERRAIARREGREPISTALRRAEQGKSNEASHIRHGDAPRAGSPSRPRTACAVAGDDRNWGSAAIPSFHKGGTTLPPVMPLKPRVMAVCRP